MELQPLRKTRAANLKGEIGEYLFSPQKVKKHQKLGHLIAYYSTQGLNLEIPSNKAPIDPIYNYKKAYNKYYKDNKDNEDNEEDFYRDRNDS